MGSGEGPRLIHHQLPAQSPRLPRGLLVLRAQPEALMLWDAGGFLEVGGAAGDASARPAHPRLLSEQPVLGKQRFTI